MSDTPIELTPEPPHKKGPSRGAKLALLALIALVVGGVIWAKATYSNPDNSVTVTSVPPTTINYLQAARDACVTDMAKTFDSATRSTQPSTVIAIKYGLQTAIGQWAIQEYSRYLTETYQVGSQTAGAHSYDRVVAYCQVNA
jgi:hypothetical protein